MEQKNNNFQKIKSEFLQVADGNGYWFKHNRTGLEIFHIKTTSPKNFFEFFVNTPADKETGIQHILEHLIFRGSKKFPNNYLFYISSQKSLN